MYRFSVGGSTIALSDSPIWVRRQLNGSLGQCDRTKAFGVMVGTTKYNLRGHNIGGIATVDYEEVQGGTYMLKQESNIDYLSMMTGIDLPNEDDKPEPVYDEEEGDE